MLRMAIVESSEVGFPNDENRTTGLRQGKQLTSPDFRRIVSDQLQRNENTMSISGERRDS